MKSCFLYKITNNVNGKMYTGITFYPAERWKYHKYNRSKKSISIIQLAIDKHGVDNFSFEVLCEGTREYIRELERKAIVLFDSIANGYNIHPGGEGNTGFKVGKREDDKPLYVAGFWFPNPRTALNKLTIPKHTLYKRLREGTAGEVYFEPARFDTSVGTAVYVGGFWFDCIFTAAEKLSTNISTLRKRIYEGFVEAFSKPKSYRLKSIWIDGIKYSSVREALKLSGVAQTTLFRELKKNNPRFYYD